ncbi:CPBP family intramembrane glutamic endopeptidase [Paenibacillus wynnii]|uniref:CAAX prenyl protease 2/Lysostaphin resistance protein A-like domain-containing protein n=1 Tax=Paenibacillus wynnii TaxID=268407 RepID=A0A098MEH7_9BACL|nr:type II CAAX endopeptidase family protein [Paenibacillus wynnii]KGE20461.1 hypothetical protein PWYN_14770 [Paenibacillus wynnii]
MIKKETNYHFRNIDFIKFSIFYLFSNIFITILLNLTSDVYITIFPQLITNLILFSFSSRMRLSIRKSLNIVVLKQMKIYLIILISLLLFLLTAILFINILKFDQTYDQQTTLIQSITTNNERISKGIFFLSISLLLPLFEEFIFRGFIFNFFLERKNFLIAMLSSSLIFGILHEDLFFTTSVFGIILCWANHRTKSLLPGIFIHVIWNTINIFH